jgi:hypothetical protein
MGVVGGEHGYGRRLPVQQPRSSSHATATNNQTMKPASNAKAMLAAIKTAANISHRIIPPLRPQAADA